MCAESISFQVPHVSLHAGESTQRYGTFKELLHPPISSLRFVCLFFRSSTDVALPDQAMSEESSEAEQHAVEEPPIVHCTDGWVTGPDSLTD